MEAEEKKVEKKRKITKLAVVTEKWVETVTGEKQFTRWSVNMLDYWANFMQKYSTWKTIQPPLPYLRFSVPVSMIAEVCNELTRKAADPKQVVWDLDFSRVLMAAENLNTEIWLEKLKTARKFTISVTPAQEIMIPDDLSVFRDAMKLDNTSDFRSEVMRLYSEDMIEKINLVMGVSNYYYGSSLGGDALTIVKDVVVVRTLHTGAHKKEKFQFYPEQAVVRFYRGQTQGEREFSYHVDLITMTYLKKMLWLDMQVTPCLAMPIGAYAQLPLGGGYDVYDLFNFQYHRAESRVFSDQLASSGIEALGKPRFFTVSKFAKYGSLTAFINRSPTRPLGSELGFTNLRELLSIWLQLIYTLAAFDAIAVIHRDLNPSNILIDDETRVPVVLSTKSLGAVTKYYRLPRVNGKTKLAIITDYGRMVVGKSNVVESYGGEMNLNILPPEIGMLTEKMARSTDGYRYSHRTDIFALGIVMISSLLGVPSVLLNDLVQPYDVPVIPGFNLIEKDHDLFHDALTKAWPTEVLRGGRDTHKRVLSAFLGYYYMMGDPQVIDGKLPRYLLADEPSTGTEPKFNPLWEYIENWSAPDIRKTPGFGWFNEPGNMITVRVGQDMAELLHRMVDWRPELRPSAREILKKLPELFKPFIVEKITKMDDVWTLDYMQLLYAAQGLPVVEILPEKLSSTTSTSSSFDIPSDIVVTAVVPSSSTTENKTNVKCDCCCSSSSVCDDHHCEICCVPQASIPVPSVEGTHSYVCSVYCRKKFLKVESYMTWLATAFELDQVQMIKTKGGQISEFTVNDYTGEYGESDLSVDKRTAKPGGAKKKPVLIPYEKVKKMMREKTIRGHKKSPAFHRLLGAMRSHYERGTPLRGYSIKKKHGKKKK